MRKWIGIACVSLGVVCLLCAIGLVIYNHWEADNASEMTKTMLADVQKVIAENKTKYPSSDTSDADNEMQNQDLSVIEPTEMATVKVDGYDCIGVLSVPALELELPVLTDWSYAKLKKAPCVYYGAYYEENFVIAAHNYKAHFGRLSELQAGDIIVFTDVNGNEYYYEVALLETLPKNATNEMITSGFDLTLYTCTQGGTNRVTVRCNTVK